MRCQQTNFSVLELAMYKADFCGSFGDSLLTLGRMLREKGLQMVLCFPEYKDWMRVFTEEGFPMEIIPYNYPINLRGIQKLLNLVKKYKVGLIHAHFGIEHHIVGTIIRLLSPMHPKLVWHWRGSPRRPNLFKKIVGSFLYRILDAILINAHIPNSDLIGDQLLSYGIVSSPKVRVVYNGINIRRFNPQQTKDVRDELGIGADEFVIGNMCNYRPEENHKIIIDTAKLILSRRDGIRFLLVGEGPTRMAIENYVETLKIRNKVIFTGLRRDVEKMYASCDLTILSHERCGENLANIVLESMAMGKPVILSNVGSASRVFKQGEGIFMVPPTPEKMAEKILELMGKPEVLTRAGELGRKVVLNGFTTEVWAKKISSIYMHLLGRVQ